MDKNTTKIDHAIANGYYLDMGTAIEKAFENYKKIALTGGLAYLLIILVFAGIGLSIAASLFSLADFTETMTNFQVTEMDTVGLVIYALISIVSAGLLSPITAGFFKMAHLAENNKEFSIATLLDYYKTTYFKDLFIAASLVALINLGFTLFFEFLGYPIAGGLFTYIIAFFTLFYVPLIIFGNQSAIDAILKSIQLVIKNPFTIIILMIIAIVGVLLGFIALCIGVLFTLPFLNSMLYTIYNEALPIDESTEIEEIGTTLE
jgi:hypothetical protein